MGREIRPGKLRRKLPSYVNHYVDVTGKARFYFRRRPGAEQVALPGLPWAPEFMAAHARALANCEHEAPSVMIGGQRTKAGTVNAAVVAYYSAPVFTRELAKGTQVSQRSLIERFRIEHENLPIGGLMQHHLQKYVSSLGSPAVQRNMLRALRHFLKFTAAQGMTKGNPADGVSRAKMVSTGGFYAWTEADVAKFEARHPVGSQARLALALYLNLGVRKSDVVRIGPRHVKGGELADFQPKKTERTNGKLITIPLLNETKAVIAATPVTGADTYLVNSWGKPYTANGFGNKMREWCDQASLPDCSSHGLRKLCLIRLADAGFSAPQIAAISGHKDLREVQVYIDTADRKRMARDVMASVEKTRGRK